MYSAQFPSWGCFCCTGEETESDQVYDVFKTNSRRRILEDTVDQTPAPTNWVLKPLEQEKPLPVLASAVACPDAKEGATS